MPEITTTSSIGARAATVVARALHALAAAACLSLASPALAQGVQPLDHEVKAAFLFRFLTYVEWPATKLPPAGAPLVIGVAGNADVRRDLLAIVAGRRVQDRPLEVRRIDTADAVEPLHALYVSSGVPAALAGTLLAQAKRHAVLSVADRQERGSDDAMIGFFVSEGRVRFDVLAYNLEQAGIRVSSRLLSVAASVRKSPFDDGSGVFGRTLLALGGAPADASAAAPLLALRERGWPLSPSFPCTTRAWPGPSTRRPA